MKIIFIGPPASGKGTQAEMLAQKLSLPLISTGNLFRQHIINKTKLGQLVEKILAAGDLVSNELTNQILEEAIKDKSNGFILDGYPRNIKQAEFLKSKTKIDVAFEIYISVKEAIRRLSGRRVCKCGATYHQIFKPSQKPDICDLCGGQLFQREDDTEEKIKYRYGIYQRETEPVINFYQEERILIKINGEPPISEVFKELIGKFEQFKLKSLK
jgi:adenylate kinase